MILLILLQTLNDTLSLNETCSPGSCPEWDCGHLTMQFLAGAFLAITFLQSGLDKVFNWKGNKEYLEGHFANSPLKGSTGLLLPLITLMELAAGSLSAAGLVVLLVNGCPYWIFLGSVLAAIALLCLFFGQRIAKDYAGAATLVGYFIAALIAIYISS